MHQSLRRDFKKRKIFQKKRHAPAVNRTRGPTMATLDFTTKPLALDSDTGNRTPVSRVTGGDTSHYTMPDLSEG